MAASPTAPPAVPRPKIEVPRPPLDGLPRERLLEGLPVEHRTPEGGDDDQRHAIVDVCAPAGYGKTTLLAMLARRLRDDGRPVAWISCDRHDNDPARLWSAVLQSMATSLQRTDGIPRESSHGAISAMQPPQHEVDPAFLAELIEVVDALPAPITVILDDVHELTSRAVLAGLDELLRNQPAQLRLVLGGRFDPPLALPRLRLAGQVHDVRADDLAFSPDETRALLATQDVHLPDDSVDLLLDRTEGWPAAVRLAALSLSDEPDPEAFVKSFAGDQRGVADYLVAEVLSRLPDDVRDFLVTTAVAEEVPVDLAAALTGRDDAGAILDRLERANSLVTRLGSGRRWYRYHTLLRSFLLAELQRGDTGAARTLHAIAADWFAAADLPDLALEHAVAAGDEVGIVALLRRFALRQLLSGSGTAVRQVLAASPAGVRSSAEAALIGAVAALEHGELSVAEQLLDAVAVPDGDDVWLMRLHDAAELYRARMRGDVTILDDPRYRGRPLRVRRGAGAAPHADADGDVALLVLTSRGALRITAGDYEGARADVTEALDIARHTGRDYLTLQCMNQLSAIAGALSDLPMTKRAAEGAITFAVARGWGSSPRMAYAYTLAAWAAYQSLDLAVATRWASTAVGVLHGAMTPEVESAARFADAVIAFDRTPDRRAALDRLRHAWSTVGAVTPSPALTAYAGMAELHMCLALGDQPRARAAVERTERVLGDGGDAAAMRAVLLLRRNHDAQARGTVDALLRGDARTEVVSNHVTGWLVEAVAAARGDEPSAAYAAVSSALALAEPIDALRPFYDLGEPVRALLISQSGRLGALDAFVVRLLEAWATAGAWQDAQAADGRDARIAPHAALGRTASRPLTVRELEILRDLPSMLTTEEIAEAHVVSVNTIKSHLKSIYRKLGATSRREAVEAGRLAGIL